jgi:hypothetical protein
MNFGKSAGGSLIYQEPTYHLPPNFTLRPFPKGPLELGTVVEDIKHFLPLNQGPNRVDIAKGERYTDTKEGISASVSKSTSGEASLLAKVLDHSIGGEASLKGERSNEDVYTIAKLVTHNFFPSKKYISDSLKLPVVLEYLVDTKYEEPVYLITGVKLAIGATVGITRGAELEGGVGASVKTQTGPIDVDVEAKAKASGKSAVSMTHTKPADFVIGIQVLKLYHAKKGLFSKERVLRKPGLETRGAVLVDDDDAPAQANFVVAALDEKDMQGTKRVDVEGVAWFVSADPA